MKNLYILTDALEYIEKNICDDIHSGGTHCGSCKVRRPPRVISGESSRR